MYIFTFAFQYVFVYFFVHLSCSFCMFIVLLVKLADLRNILKGQSQKRIALGDKLFEK